ncbi:threonine synthase, partial [Aduncisulcus paluster]
MALSILPHFMKTSAKKLGTKEDIVILAATSGDTGKAALEGFADVDGTQIVVFYPTDGVSDVQKRQMITQEGANTHVFGINGNFDDAQSGAGKINLGDKINIVVPTGNFGNILAAYYAMRMGLPVKEFICASNKNNVLADFFKTGRYDLDRDFIPTVSPSMDILISSNLERFLYAISGNDDTAISGLMADLKAKGAYEISDAMKDNMKNFHGGYADDPKTVDAIRNLYD